MINQSYARNTCNNRCQQAKRLKCSCSCQGANHGLQTDTYPGNRRTAARRARQVLPIPMELPGARTRPGRPLPPIKQPTFRTKRLRPAGNAKAQILNNGAKPPAPETAPPCPLCPSPPAHQEPTQLFLNSPETTPPAQLCPRHRPEPNKPPVETI